MKITVQTFLGLSSLMLLSAGCFNGQMSFLKKSVALSATTTMESPKLYVNANRATGSSPGINTPNFTSSWTNLGSGGVGLGGLLFNFSGSATSGWGGGAAAAPYFLAFDGGNDRVEFGSVMASEDRSTFLGWIMPSNSARAGSILLSSAETDGRGIILKQSRWNPGFLELHTGKLPYADTVLNDAPMGYWKLDETLLSQPAKDFSGNVFQGTYSGVSLGSPIPENSIDRAVEFRSSSSSYVAVSSFPHLASVISVEAWFYKTTVPSTSETLVSYGQNSMQEWRLQIDSAMKVSFVVLSNSTPRQSPLSAPLSLNTWYHVVASFDANMLNLFIDGQSQGAPVLHAQPIDSVPNADLLIGAAPNGSSYFNGRIDEVAIYSAALPAARVSEHFIARRHPYCLSKSPLANGIWQMVSGSLTPTDLYLSLNGRVDCQSSILGWDARPTAASVLVMGSKSDSTNAWAGKVSEFKLSTSLPDFGAIKGQLSSALAQYRSTPPPNDGALSSQDLALDLDAAFANGVDRGCTDGNNPVLRWMDRSDSGLDGIFVGMTPGCGSSHGWRMNPDQFFLGSAGAYVELSDPSSSVFNFGNNSFSIEAWVNVSNSGTSQDRVIVAKDPGPATPRSGYALLVSDDPASSGYGKFEVYASGTTQFVDTGIGIANTGWHHLVATRGADAVSIYLDGVLRDTAGFPPAGGAVLSNTSQFLIGRRADGTSGLLGSLGRIRVYQRELLTSEISQNCFALRDRYGMSCM